MMLRIFYRNRPDKDTKIVSWSTDLNQAPLAFQLAINLDVNDLSYQATNSRGVPLKRIVNDTIVDRDVADVAKDINNKQYLYQACELEISTYLLGKEKVSWAAVACKHLFEYLKALQEAAGIADNQLSSGGQSSKGTLSWLSANINGPIEASMINRDAAIALLDVED